MQCVEVGHDEHLPAERQAEMRHLDGLHDPAELDMLMAPIELTDLAGEERQRHVGRGESWAGFDSFPTPDEALLAVVGATIALGLQSLEQTTCGAVRR